MKKKENEKIEAVLKQAKLDALLTALNDILKLEYNKTISAENEKPEIDYELTLRMVRTRARMALDVVDKMSLIEKK